MRLFHQINTLSKIQLALLVTVFTFLFQIGLTYPLWLPLFRVFPTASVFNFPSIFIETVLSILLIINLLSSIFYPKKALLIGSFTLGFLLITFDLIRLQAWVYQHLFFLLIIGLTIAKKQTLGIWALRLWLIFTYFWSGIHKMNPHFAETVFPWLVSTFSWTSKMGQNTDLGYVLAFSEALLGMGLLVKKTRKVFVILTTLFHLSILTIIGPFGQGWNPVIYPWNVGMIGLVWVLFWKNSPSYTFTINLFKTSPLLPLVSILVGICPSLNFINAFPETMSMTMYNGISSEIALVFKNEEPMNCLPKIAKKDSYPRLEEQVLHLDDWALKELKVPIYHTPFLARALSKKICRCLIYPENGHIEITLTKRWDMENSYEIIPLPCQ